MSKPQWIETAKETPEPNRYVIGVNESGLVLVVWHKSMGYVCGGDFATVTKGKRTTKFSHCHGVTKWMYIPEFK